MSNTNIEQMKKLIEEKKKKSTKQGKGGSRTSKTNECPDKGFKRMKKAGSLNK